MYKIVLALLDLLSLHVSCGQVTCAAASEVWYALWMYPTLPCSIRADIT